MSKKIGLLKSIGALCSIVLLSGTVTSLSDWKKLYFSLIGRTSILHCILTLASAQTFKHGKGDSGLCCSLTFFAFQ